MARCYLQITHPVTNPLLTNSKKNPTIDTIETRSYHSLGVGGDSQSIIEREPIRSKDRRLLSYNNNIYIYIYIYIYIDKGCGCIIWYAYTSL